MATTNAERVAALAAERREELIDDAYHALELARAGLPTHMPNWSTDDLLWYASAVAAVVAADVAMGPRRKPAHP